LRKGEGCGIVGGCMKFNKEMQEKLDILLKSWEDPYDLKEYEETFNDIGWRTEIQRIVGASHELGLDLSPLQAFQLWYFISGEWGCSGWMSIGGTVDIADMLKHAIDILEYKKLLV
jgi:hypothetical protein